MGKSTILSRLTGSDYSDNYASTIGVDFVATYIELPDHRRFKLQRWDTVGSRRLLLVCKAKQAFARRVRKGSEQ